MIDNDFQQRVMLWLNEAFPRSVIYSRKQRAQRFLEESLELAQAMDLTEGEALDLVAYVYDRKVGQIHQEIGGVVITLCALGSVAGYGLSSCAHLEIERCEANIEKIRAKQLTKPDAVSDHNTYEDPRMRLELKDVSIDDGRRVQQPLKSSKA
jgi:hypothetical protein